MIPVSKIIVLRTGPACDWIEFAIIGFVIFSNYAVIDMYTQRLLVNGQSG